VGRVGGGGRRLLRATRMGLAGPPCWSSGLTSTSTLRWRLGEGVGGGVSLGEGGWEEEVWTVTLVR
jgi:hypothetical protein